MKTIFKTIFFPFFLLFKKRQPKIKAKIQEVTSEYERLINEYRLIKEGTSKLSSRQRKFTEARVLDLIGRGHIKVN